ncbi:DinB family protein [Chitinophaga sp. ARDCPP14]|uniref:DinB family protein n=1 Tax=Chitinophaga sp. ARDCPP14 TaxID=3391139 RepID=UPI003F51F60B
MDSSLKITLWHQFGASIDMLENALTFCPDELWDTPAKFWYIGYHTLFFLDFYLSDETPMEKDFLPPEPFTLSEFGTGMPERVYDKTELLTYLRFGREKLRGLLTRLTAEDILTKRFVSEYKDYSILEILIYNMRHVQHHTAQLNLLLRQEVKDAPDWVSATKADLAL